MIYPSFIHYLLTCCCLLNHPPAFSAPITSFVSPQEQLIQEKNTACSLATYQGKSLQKKLGSSSDGLLVFPLVSQSFWEIGWLGMPRGSESNGQFDGFLYVYCIYIWIWAICSILSYPMIYGTIHYFRWSTFSNPTQPTAEWQQVIQVIHFINVLLFRTW